jgi:AraC-like DNA-binding protein
MGMNNVFCCEYSGKTKGARYEAWREQFAHRWISTDFEPIGGDHISNEVRASEHSFIGLCKMISTPVRIERRSDAAAHSTRYLIVAARSPLHASQRGRSLDLSPGQMVLLSAEEPAQVAHLAGGDRWSIRIPAALLGEVCNNIDDKIACPVVAPDHLSELLLNLVETAHRFGSKLDASANHTVAQHLLDLVALCLGARVDAGDIAGRRGLAAARLESIKADILRRLIRTDTTLARIAARHRVSTRYVQYLFGLCGTSFTSFVLDHRLLLAYRLLRDPQNRWRKVSDIATSSGFSDISYFNRVFKGRFGETPTDVRSQASLWD